MSITVYNTLTRRKEEFVPLHSDVVRIYVCGITPYDESHIGHGVPAIIWDAICRFLEYRGFRTKLVQNFTDVDDKVIARSRETGVPALELSARYIQSYLDALSALGVRPADVYCKVSEHIDDVVEMVQALVERGAAYVVDGDVFFAVERFPEYGKLSGQRPEELESGTRFDVDERKKHPADFALWKSAKPGEPAWESPWGQGRPGWHIECSAMSLKYLGNHIDMHGGGLDLIFPHHENEIAQSEAYTQDAPFVRFWVHNGLLKTGQAKMSKSLGNFTTISDLLGKYPAGAVRFYVLSTHYRSPLEFDEAHLDEALKGWKRLNDSVANWRRIVTELGTIEEVAGGQGSEELGSKGAELLAMLAHTESKFIAAMEDDFNSALAIGTLFELLRPINGLVAQLSADSLSGVGIVVQALDLAERLAGDVLGLLREPEATSDAAAGLTNELMELILRVREDARTRKDWTTADAIRNGLSELGITISDSPAGPQWKLEK